MERKFRQSWSTIPPISTERTADGQRFHQYPQNEQLMVNDSTNIHNTNSRLLPKIIKHKYDFIIFDDVPLLHHHDDS